MASGIPLIRAAALVPMLRWMKVHGRNVQETLSAEDISWYPWRDPVQPIPLRNAAEFLKTLSRAEGPDTPFRIVGDTGLFELAMLARVALGTQTPREALGRIAAAIPYHCSHETLTLQVDQGDLVIREHLDLDLDEETRHLVHQYLVAMIKVLFGMTKAGNDRPPSILMRPHPEYGFAHLDRWLDRAPIASDETVELRYPLGVADGRFTDIARDRLSRSSQADWQPLRADGSLSTSVAMLLPGMMSHRELGIDHIATYAGMTRRTFQRRLLDEGVLFSDLLDDARKRIGLELLEDESRSLGEITRLLGYARQSTTTRAFKRWTGRTPQAWRTAISAGR